MLYLCELIKSLHPHEIAAIVIIPISQHRELNSLPKIAELAKSRMRFQTKEVSFRHLPVLPFLNSGQKSPTTEQPF